jgi:hypothetical protein
MVFHLTFAILPIRTKLSFLSEFNSKECKEKSTSFFRDWITIGEKTGRKTRFFGEKRRLIFLIFRLEKGKKNPTPSKESDFLFCWCRLTESNRQPTDYDGLFSAFEVYQFICPKKVGT